MDDQTAQAELENLFLWILRQKNIPLQTRYDFALHVTKLGGLDQKSIEFIQNYLNNEEAIARGNISILEKQLAEFNNYLEAEKNPQTSTKESLLHAAESEFLRLSDNFRIDWNLFKQNQSAAAESQEKTSEQDEIERLKSQL